MFTGIGTWYVSIDAWYDRIDLWYKFSLVLVHDMSVLMYDMIYVSRDITHAIPASANLHDNPGGWPILHYPILCHTLSLPPSPTLSSLSGTEGDTLWITYQKYMLGFQ